MELYPGGDLFEQVMKHGPMKEADSAEVMLGLLSALAHVHSLGIVHRDVKCENILIAENRAILADFGIAASLADTGAMDKRVGSPGYAAPEVLTGEPYSEKIDVFAAGVVLYYCLSAVLPFADSSVEKILARTVRAGLRLTVVALLCEQALKPLIVADL
ncbi:PEPKR2 [Symbiodinium natans]|uniref:PEPKR2 protein n=1 Tax=Symbiodinium natans TaxID=878477 RepID=A0A812TN74_9DINO|nr:PEPKR2 [Symbiodinium natans]